MPSTTITYYVLTNALNQYMHRYQDDDRVVKTTRHFCDAKHFYVEPDHVYEGFKKVKVTSILG